MFASASRSDQANTLPTPIPQYVRATSEVRASFARYGRSTRLADCYETGGLRLRLPSAGGRCDGVLINIAGGMTGGDRAKIAVEVGRAAHVRLTTQSAEKVYRAEGEAASSDVSLSIADDASLAWIPQETILFDRSALRRSLTVEMGKTSAVTLFEMTVFGRAARDEVWTAGGFRDSWRVRRGGELVFADDVRIQGDVRNVMARAATAGGASAIATLLFVSPNAESRLNAVRDALRETAINCGASAWNDMLIVRFVAHDAQELRRCSRAALQRILRDDVPRIWSS